MIEGPAVSLSRHFFFLDCPSRESDSRIGPIKMKNRIRADPNKAIMLLLRRVPGLRNNDAASPSCAFPVQAVSASID